MRINNRDITDLNATLNGFTYESSAVEREILNNGIGHILLSSTVKPQIRSLIVTFTSEQDISRFSALIASHPLEIDTEDGFIYDCLLTTTPLVEHLGRDYYTVTYVLSCIKKGHRQRFKVVFPCVNINILGNQPTPPIITIIPKQNADAVTICGITVRNLRKDCTVIIDSIDKLIEENGENKFNDCDLKQFCRLIPGVQEITASSDQVDVLIEYDPIYM